MQTMVNDLRRAVVGRRISFVWSDLPKRKLPELGRLTGTRIEAVSRRGKNILFLLSRSRKKFLFVVHPRMTGHFLLGRWALSKNSRLRPRPLASSGPMVEKVNSYLHLILAFADGEMLGLSDARKFSKLLFGPEKEVGALEYFGKLGPDALSPSLTLPEFRRRIYKNKPVKTVLLDQAIVSGIGNIYSDEILYAAGIDPRRQAAQLSKEEAGRIYKAMRSILREAVKVRGTSFSDFRDLRGRKGGYGERRLVYGLSATPCRRCRTPIVSIKIGGRTSSFCPVCQK